MNTLLNPQSKFFRLVPLLLASAFLMLASDFLFFGHKPGATSLAIFSAFLFFLSLPLQRAFYRGTANKALGALAALSLCALAFEFTACSLFLALFFIASLRISAVFDRKDAPIERLKQVLLFYITMPFDIFQSKEETADFDEEKFRKDEARRDKISHHILIWLIVLPLAGLFIILFSAATPDIFKVFNGAMGFIFDIAKPYRITFLVFSFVLAFSFLRMRLFKALILKDAKCEEPPSAGNSQWLKSFLFAALSVFNLIFLFQNYFDLRWLLGGMHLPEGVTYSKYANEGAYALAIATGIAAVFITVAFRQAADPSSWRKIRALAYVWIAQNIFLIFSASMRMLDYVWVYGLTDTRMMGFSFFALVAVGFILSIIKISKNKSIAWLINTNLYAVAALFLCWGLVDVKRLCADYNVSRFEAGTIRSIDIEYIQLLGASSLPAAQRLLHVLESGENTDSLKPALIMDGAKIELTTQGAISRLKGFIEREKYALEESLQDWRTASVNERIIASKMID